MPNKAFHLLIDALERDRGDFLHGVSRALSRIRDLLLRRDFTLQYKFESAKDLKAYKFDSKLLLDSCALEISV